MLNSESVKPMHYIFYFPYKGVGGVPVLFLNVAKELNKRGYLTSVVDFNDGYMAINKGAETTLIPYDLDKSVSIPENSIVIFQSDLPWGIPKNLICQSSTKIFFWNCYPFNLVPNLPKPLGDFLSCRIFLLQILLHTFLNSARLKTKKMTELLINKKALCFMDYPNWSLTKNMLSIESLPEIFMPILVTSIENLKPTKMNNLSLRCGWVGRLADFKIYPLLRVLEDLNTCNQKNILFTIIGSGQYESFLKKKCIQYKNLKIEFIENMPYNKIHRYLNEYIDLLFAMGTSALDGGLSAVPTVLMNFSYKEISNAYRYRFLNQTEKFSLGDLISNENISQGILIDKILLSIIENKEILGIECQNYVINNHLIENKIDIFLQLTQASELSYDRLLLTADLEKPGFYKIWSLIKKFL